jgi:hypothetical protein
MATQLSITVRNAKLDVVETTIGVSSRLMIRTGAQPADCATASSGTVLADVTNPSDWMSAASAGVKSKLGTWSIAASGTGTAGHYRIYDSTGTTCHVQGSVTLTGGGGDMTVDNTSIASGQAVVVTAYSWTEANA